MAVSEEAGGVLAEPPYLIQIADLIRQVAGHEGESARDDLLFLIYAVLALSKGEATVSADVHDAWAAFSLATHSPSHKIKPFAELSIREQAADGPFTAAIRQVARQLNLKDRADRPS